MDSIYSRQADQFKIRLRRSGIGVEASKCKTSCTRTPWCFSRRSFSGRDSNPLVTTKALTTGLMNIARLAKAAPLDMWQMRLNIAQGHRHGIQHRSLARPVFAHQQSQATPQRQVQGLKNSSRFDDVQNIALVMKVRRLENHPNLHTHLRLKRCQLKRNVEHGQPICWVSRQAIDRQLL